jgi:hypothetical protein
MQLMPTTKQEWSRFIGYPFKAYTVIAFPCILILDQDALLFRFGSAVAVVMIGYWLAGAILILEGLIQKYVFKSQERTSSFTFGTIALFIGFVVMPMFFLARSEDSHVA